MCFGLLCFILDCFLLFPGSLWVVEDFVWIAMGCCGLFGSIWFVVDFIWIVVGCCESLWVVPCFGKYVSCVKLGTKTWSNSK